MKRSMAVPNLGKQVYASLTLKNGPGAIVCGVAKQLQNGILYSIEKNVVIKTNDLTLKCNFRNLKYAHQTDFKFKKIVCTGTFVNEEINREVLNVSSVDFSDLKVADQIQFIEFLKKNISQSGINHLALPVFSDENLCLASEWIVGLGNLRGFSYKVDPNNKIQVNVIKLIQILINKQMLTVQNIGTYQLVPPVTFNKEMVEYKESKYDANQNLLIAMFYPDKNTFEFRCESDFNWIEARMDQLTAYKNMSAQIRHVKICGEFVNVDVKLKLYSLNFHSTNVPDSKIKEFLEFLVKQKVVNLALPRLNAFDFKHTYQSLLQIEDLVMIRITDAEKNEKLKELELVVNAELNNRINKDKIEHIKKKNKLDT